MSHVMLKYPEVYTDLQFIPIPTMPLELRFGAVIKTYDEKETEDGAYLTLASDSVSIRICLPEWIQHHNNQNILLDDLKMSNISIEKLSQFCLRPPEFVGFIDNIGHFFHWF